MSDPDPGPRILPVPECDAQASTSRQTSIALMPETQPVLVSLSELGIRLRRLRDDRGLSLRAAAEATGVSHAMISKIENGAITTTPTLLALIRGLGGAVAIVDRRGGAR